MSNTKWCCLTESRSKCDAKQPRREAGTNAVNCSRRSSHRAVRDVFSEGPTAHMEIRVCFLLGSAWFPVKVELERGFGTSSSFGE